VALAIAADIHPVQNLGVLNRIEALSGAGAARRWAQDTLVRGMTAVEALVAPNAGPFAFGEAPTLADILIVPQLFNCRRFGVDLSPFPRIAGIETACADLPAFRAAHPDAQPDAL
jgi:maleylacetoacetate isomerase